MGGAGGLLNRINERYKSLSKGQKLLAAYITDNYDQAAFLTASRLGQAVGVSESTVVRFASQLGYKGYPEFQRAMGELVQSKLHDVHRMEDVYGRISQSEILETVLKSDMERIKNTLENIDAHAFDLAVDMILDARRIYVLGIRSCGSLAEFLAFYLNMMFDDVRLLHTSSSSELLEQMVRIGKEDVMIGISFPRYSIRTLKAMELANAICANAPIAVQESKRCIRMGMQIDIATGSAFEAEAFGVTCGTEDKNEGMGAFLEKRAEKHFQNK